MCSKEQRHLSSRCLKTRKTLQHSFTFCQTRPHKLKRGSSASIPQYERLHKNSMKATAPPEIAMKRVSMLPRSGQQHFTKTPPHLLCLPGPSPGFHVKACPPTLHVIHKQRKFHRETPSYGWFFQKSPVSQI